MLDARTGELLLVDTRTARAPLTTVLKACTSIPVAYNRSIEVDGRLCIDAGVANPFPMQEALASGCTDLLVLLTRPRGFRREKPGLASSWIFKAYARGKSELRRAYARQPERDAELRDLALGRAPVRAGVNIATLCVGDEEVVQRLTVDPIRLHAAAVGCGRRMLKVMDADPEGWSLPAPA
jgi:predicted acylesterase/phospholipase RssA